MNVGDIITLSKSASHTSILRHRRDKMGIITDVQAKYPFKDSALKVQYDKKLYYVHWFVEGDSKDGFPFNRRDLIHLKSSAI